MRSSSGLPRLDLLPFATDHVLPSRPSQDGNETQRLSLHTIEYEKAARARDLLQLLPSTQVPTQSTQPASVFLASIRAKTLLDFKFMREFSLVKQRPIPERSLTKLSANSLYGIRMAQMNLETQSLERRMYTTTESNAKANDEIRTTKIPEKSSSVRHGGVKAFRRFNVSHTSPLTNTSNNHEETETLTEREDSKFFPTLWTHDNTSTTVYRQRQLEPQPSLSSPSHPHISGIVRRPSAHSVQKPNDPPGPLISDDLSEFNRRKCHSTSKVIDHHGFLQEQDIPQLLQETGYDRTELYTLWTRFKALCSISKSPQGIDKDTFRRGIPLLSLEDQFFIDRVFEILDADGSGILEWKEFIEALSALEKGDVSKRISFLFRVYDLNGDTMIDRSEIHQFFLASLLVKPTEDLTDVANHFIDQIFEVMGCKGQERMRTSSVMTYIQSHPAADIYSLFGRTMVTKET